MDSDDEIMDDPPMDDITRERLRVEGLITESYQAIVSLGDPKESSEVYQNVLAKGYLHDNGQGTITIEDDNDKTLSNEEAVIFSASKQWNYTYKLMQMLKKYDKKWAAWEVNGGSDPTPNAENPEIIRMLDTLLAWPEIFLNYIQSMQTVSTFTDPTLYQNLRMDLPKLRLKNRFFISRHLNTLITKEKFKSSHLICTAIMSHMRENDFVLHDDKVWKRNMRKKRVILTYNFSRICNECGKMENEHSSDTCHRKSCVFEPMTLPCDSTMTFDTHTYIKHMDLDKYIYSVCNEIYHDRWFNIIEDKGSRKFVQELLLISGWAPHMKVRRGLFAFNNGLFDVETNIFYPYECCCHSLWSDGKDYGYPLEGLPRRRTTTQRSFNIEKDREWLFPDKEGNYSEKNVVPDNHTPVYCENCRAGCCPPTWIAQKQLDAYFDRDRYWSQMRGPMIGDISQIECKLCGNAYSHPIHHAECEKFIPSPEDFFTCAVCGAHKDDDCHHSQCKMWFSESPYENLSCFVKDTDTCLTCGRMYDDCGCPMFSPFDFKKDPEHPFKNPVTRNISIPTFSSIFHMQDIPDPIIDFFITMISRSLLEPQKYDKMQMMVFVKGPAGNGKTTIIDFMVSFFERSNTGPIANGAQAEFPFEQCINKDTHTTKHFVYFPEVKSTCKIDTGEIQKLCDVEKNYPFNIKGKTVIKADIDFTLWAAGNEFFGQDAGDSMARRLFNVYFPHRVQDDKQDPNLLDRLKKREVGAILCRSALQFYFLRQHYKGGPTFQNVCADIKKYCGCDYIKKQQKAMQEVIQPVHQFLKGCDQQNLKIVGCKNTESAILNCYAKNNYISYKRFIDAYKKFNAPNRPKPLTQEVWDQPFKSYKLIYDPDKIEERDCWDSEKQELVPVRGTFILGIRDIEDRKRRRKNLKVTMMRKKKKRKSI